VVQCKKLLTSAHASAVHAKLLAEYEKDRLAPLSGARWEARARRLRSLLSVAAYRVLENKYKVRRTLGVSEQVRGFVAMALREWKAAAKAEQVVETLFDGFAGTLRELGEFWNARQHPGRVRR
jgi:hypothetical protein